MVVLLSTENHFSSGELKQNLQFFKYFFSNSITSAQRKLSTLLDGKTSARQQRQKEDETKIQRHQQVSEKEYKTNNFERFDCVHIVHWIWNPQQNHFQVKIHSKISWLHVEGNQWTLQLTLVHSFINLNCARKLDFIIAAAQRLFHERGHRRSATTNYMDERRALDEQYILADDAVWQR